MIQRNLQIDQIAPWLISGASGCYIVARARQLSQARASRATWMHFLTHQSDVILALCGCPAIWHIARRRAMRVRLTRNATGDHDGLMVGAVHQLRQVFTVLLLGLGMIRRRVSDRKTIALIQRLQGITRTGASLLSALDEPGPAALLMDDDAHINQNGDYDQARYV
jgi:hypothetical protein